MKESHTLSIEENVEFAVSYEQPQSGGRLTISTTYNDCIISTHMTTEEMRKLIAILSIVAYA